MSLIYIEEPGLKFGPYEESDVYRIEKSKLLQSKRFQGIKITEFILRRQLKGMDTFSMIEAKSSSPYSNDVEYNEFIESIAQKFSNTLNIMCALHIGREHLKEEKVPEFVKSDVIAGSNLQFILVINGHKSEALVPIKNSLEKRLKRLMKIYDIKVIVINENFARKYKLIV